MLRLPIVSVSCVNHENMKAKKRAKLRKIGKSIRKLADTLDDIAKKDFELTKEILTEKVDKDLSLVQDRQAREASFDIFD